MIASLPFELPSTFRRSNMVKVVNNDSEPNDSSSSKTHARRSNSKSKLLLPLKVKPKPRLERPIAVEYNPTDSRILTPDFFQIDALELAPLLLGKFIRRDDVVLQITEVEAYRANDSACHGRFGITPRTAPMFGPGGHAYVYLCYGLHMMFNVVADKEGNGAAVLIRASAPLAGLKTIQQRRGQITEKPTLLTGPGKVGQALGLTTEWSNHPLYEAGGLELLDGPKPESILVGPRIGIEYALPEHVSAPWRFAIAGTPWVKVTGARLDLMSKTQQTQLTLEGIDNIDQEKEQNSSFNRGGTVLFLGGFKDELGVIIHGCSCRRCIKEETELVYGHLIKDDLWTSLNLYTGCNI